MSDWKENRTKIMRKVATEISTQSEGEEDAAAVLLFGSAVTKDIHPESDVDIVIVRDSKKNLMERKEFFVRGIKIDLWEHSSSLYENLFKKDWQPTQMFWYSLFLNVLQECEVLYDKNSRFRNHQKNAINWEWPAECRDFMSFRLGRALSNYHEGDYDKLGN